MKPGNSTVTCVAPRGTTLVAVSTWPADEMTAPEPVNEPPSTSQEILTVVASTRSAIAWMPTASAARTVADGRGAPVQQATKMATMAARAATPLRMEPSVCRHRTA